MTHNELQDDLATHLRAGTDRMVWTNTQLGPSGSPRPDVFTVNKSFARFRSDCYEVKVSVSDLRHDVTSGKWQSYRKFGHAVWFAFPRGMASIDLIPAECGVILRGDSWRAARKPVAQVLDTLPREAWLKLLMTAEVGAEEPSPRPMSWWKAEEIARKKFGVELAELFRARRGAQHAYELATKRLNDSAEEINTDVEQRRQRAREQERFDQQALDHALLDLAAALGLAGEKITANEVTNALRAMRRRLVRHPLADTIQLLQQLQTDLQATGEPG